MLQILQLLDIEPNSFSEYPDVQLTSSLVYLSFLPYSLVHFTALMPLASDLLHSTWVSFLLKCPVTQTYIHFSLLILTVANLLVEGTIS